MNNNIQTQAFSGLFFHPNKQSGKSFVLDFPEVFSNYHQGLNPRTP